MPEGLENLDPDSRKILEQAMSMDSSMRAMGMREIQASEQRQLAEDMERKNAEARRRRGAAILGEDPVMATIKRQTPIKRRRGMVTQENVMPLSNPEHIAPEVQLPTEAAPAESVVDANEMRKTFSKIGNRGKSNAVEKPPVPPVPPVQEAQPEPAAPEPKAETPIVHAVPTQELNDCPYDIEEGEFGVFNRVSRLPSKGLFYPAPIMGQALKLVDNYFLDDVIDGSMTTRLAINSILKRRIRGIAPEDIVTIDESYLLHWLRASSFPKHGLWHPGYKCPHCQFDTSKEDIYNEFQIGFRNLKFTLTKDIDQLYELHRVNGYHKGFLDDGRECHVYIHRLRHAMELNKFISEWEQKFEMDAPNAIRKIAGVATVTEIEDCEDMWDKFNYISELSPAEKPVLEDLVVAGTVACNISAVITCSRCGGMVETPYPFLVRRFVSSL